MLRSLALATLLLLAVSCSAQWRNQPGSCRAAAIQAGVDGFNGKGTSQQSLMYQRRCETDRAIAAANEMHAAQAAQIAELQQLGRQRLELERQQLALAQAQADEARVDAARANAEAIRSGQAAPVATGTTAASTKVLLFGGRDHKTFLGCVCDETDPDSVLNKYGEYGSRYSVDSSIWNRYGDYGSKYADTSACNKYASYPPILVTDAGDAVGYLTLNRYQTGAITDPAVFDWLNKTVCENE